MNAIWIPESVQIIIKLLSFGADPNIPDVHGRTCLHNVVRYGCIQKAARLLDGGAETDVADQMGWYPLHYAVQEEDLFFLLDLLVQRGANCNVSNKEGVTPLMMAIYKVSLQFANLLLSNGAEVNARDHQNKTALHRMLDLETETGPDMDFDVDQRDGAILLLSRGADPDLADSEGITGLHMAAFWVGSRCLLRQSQKDRSYPHLRFVPTDAEAKEFLFSVLKKSKKPYAEDKDGMHFVHYLASGLSGTPLEGDNNYVSRYLNQHILRVTYLEIDRMKLDLPLLMHFVGLKDPCIHDGGTHPLEIALGFLVLHSTDIGCFVEVEKVLKSMGPPSLQCACAQVLAPYRESKQMKETLPEALLTLVENHADICSLSRFINYLKTPFL